MTTKMVQGHTFPRMSRALPVLGMQKSPSSLGRAFLHTKRNIACAVSADSCEGEQPEEDGGHPIFQKQEEKDFMIQKGVALPVTIL